MAELVDLDALAAAAAYAARVHAGQMRPDASDVPQLAHLLAVCGTVLDHGGSTEQAIAALLHDTVEDHGGFLRLDLIHRDFGPRVAALVEACSDSLVDTAQAAKRPWWERKCQHLARLRAERSAAAALVVAADGLDRARNLLRSYRQLGEDVWHRADPDAGRLGVLWHHRRVAMVVRPFLAERPRTASLVVELQEAVDALLGEADRRLGADTTAEEWDAARRKERATLALLGTA